MHWDQLRQFRIHDAFIIHAAWAWNVFLFLFFFPFSFEPIPFCSGAGRSQKKDIAMINTLRTP